MSKKVKVRVKPEIIKMGSGFHDFYSHTDIYPRKSDQVFEIEMTPFIKRKLDTGELILIGTKPSAAPKPEEKAKEEPKKSK